MIVVWMNPKRDHVAAHAAHRDPVADVEGLAAEDHEVAGDAVITRCSANARPAVTRPTRSASRAGSSNQIETRPRIAVAAASPG